MKGSENKKKILIIIIAVFILGFSLFKISQDYFYKDLVEAIENEDMETFSRDLKFVVNLNRPPASKLTVFFADQYFNTPLQEACYDGNFDMVKTLVEHGADVNYTVKGVAPFSALYLTISGDGWGPGKDHVRIAEYLLSQGAEVDYIGDELGEQRMTALFEVADYRPHPHALELIDLLCENGADINFMTNYGTVMHTACQFGYEEIILHIIDHYSADLNLQQAHSNLTCLMYYCRDNDNPEIVRALLDAGADPSLKDKDGKTAHDYAAENGHEDLLPLLVE